MRYSRLYSHTFSFIQNITSYYFYSKFFTSIYQTVLKNENISKYNQLWYTNPMKDSKKNLSDQEQMPIEQFMQQLVESQKIGKNRLSNL